jgi:hypothetical protein
MPREASSCATMVSVSGVLDGLWNQAEESRALTGTLLAPLSPVNWPTDLVIALRISPALFLNWASFSPRSLIAFRTSFKFLWMVT